MQILRFIIVGIINTAIGFGCILVAISVLKLDYRIANAIGYAVGCVFGFLLNRSWTFKYRGSWLNRLTRWFVIVGGAYALNILTVVGLHESLGIGNYAAQGAGAVVYTGIAFLGGRYVAFAGQDKDNMVGAGD